MGKARDSWVNFKKKHPSFEKSKSYKVDLGPLLDKYEKQIIAMNKTLEKIEKRLGDLEKSTGPVHESLKRYSAIAAEVAQKYGRTDIITFTGGGDVKKISQGMQADFDAFRKTVDIRGERLGKIMRALARNSEKYEVDW